MSSLFPCKKNTQRLKRLQLCHLNDLCLSLLTLCSDGAGRSGTYILIDMVLNRMAKGNDQWLPFHSFCLRWSVALATLKPLIFHWGSWGCIRGWLFWGLERQRTQRQTWRELLEVERAEQRENREKGKWIETYTHISSFLFKPLSHYIDLHHNPSMNLDCTYMGMKRLREKYISMLLQWFEFIFNI